jgi:hypothetical protein
MRIGFRAYATGLSYEVDDLDYEASLSGGRGLDDLVEIELTDYVEDVHEFLDLLNEFVEEADVEIPKGYAIGLVKLPKAKGRKA